MSNFDDLSDIDHNSKEVYETSDVEESFDIQDDSIKKRDSISEPIFDLDKSRAVFETKMIDAHVTDFSDRIDRVDQTYETYDVKETIPNKLSRIRKELEELEDELDEGEVDADEVKRLQQLFEKLNSRTRDKKVVVLKDLKSENNDIVIDKFINKEDPEQVVELDKRINKLERTIGDELFDNSIQSMVNDLFRKFKLLSNDQDSLHKINSIIDEVNLKFEKSITTRRSLDNIQNEISEETKFNEIYMKFNKAQDFENELPFIIKRLESLNDVHQKLSNSVNFTESMEQDIITMSKDIENWEGSLTKLETKLNDLATSFETIKKTSSS